MTNVQFLLSIGIPSVLVILSWISNNTRLSRLETASDALQRRMDDFQRGMHNDMLSFQAALLGEMANLRERVAAVEARR
jgi:hypothetical protein